MSQLLEVYRDFAKSSTRTLSTQMLRDRGFSAAHARVTLARLRQVGLAESKGPGTVHLLLPSEAKAPLVPDRDPVEWWMSRFKAKRTGFSVVPPRYPSPRPKEFIVAPRDLQAARRALQKKAPETEVRLNEYVARNAVCLYQGKVRGDTATLEEALMHIYRHAPRGDFALALQAALQTRPKLNWSWFRRQPEWRELAGVFVGVNQVAGRHVFPQFRVTEWPELSQDQLQTVAQAFTARGARRLVT